MKVEIKVLPEAKEPYAVIYASEITEIRRTAALLETKNSGVVSVMENSASSCFAPMKSTWCGWKTKRRSYIPRRSGITAASGCMRFEEIAWKRIYENLKGTLQTCLPDYVESTLGGLLLLVLKNGCKECISRKYLPAFKQYLGL